MTNDELETKLDHHVQQERQTTREILQLILLAEDRKLYLARGQESMVRWLCVRFKYSATAAQRRVASARLLRAVPELDQKLAAGDVNLTTLAMTQSVLQQEEKRTGNKITPEQKAEVVQAIETQSQSNAERTLAEIFPETMDQPKREQVKLVADDCVRMHLTLTREEYDAICEARDLMGHTVPDGEFAKVLHRACVEYKKRNDPAREVRVTKCETGAEIPRPTRRQVFKRDEGKCQFKDPRTGVKCEIKRRVQVDHIIPKACGGTNELENLRCLCQAHNLYRAEKTFGHYSNFTAH